MIPTRYLDPVAKIFRRTNISKKRLLVFPYSGIIRIAENFQHNLYRKRYLFIVKTPYNYKRPNFGRAETPKYLYLQSYQHELSEAYLIKTGIGVDHQELFDVIINSAPEDISELMLFNLDQFTGDKT